MVWHAIAAPRMHHLIPTFDASSMMTLIYLAVLPAE